MLWNVCFGVGLSVIPLAGGIVCKRGLGDYKSLDFDLWKRTRYTSLVQCAAAGVLDRLCKGVEFNSTTFQCKCFGRHGYKMNLTSEIESYHLACGRTQRLDKKGFLPGYIGCYETGDYYSKILLKETIYRPVAQMHVDGCLLSSLKRRLKYATLWKGGICYCPKVFDFAPMRVSDEEFRKPCKGNRDQYCGGNGALAVYDLDVNKET